MSRAQCAEVEQGADTRALPSCGWRPSAHWRPVHTFNALTQRRSAQSRKEARPRNALDQGHEDWEASADDAYTNVYNRPYFCLPVGWYPATCDIAKDHFDQARDDDAGIYERYVKTPAVVTHNAPRRKMPATLSFLCQDICISDTTRIGRARMITSRSTSHAPAATQKVLKLKQ